jgi:hypothetical protein
MEACPAPGKKRPRVKPLLSVWKARSVFWDLPYWKYLHTPHSLDHMHITKNVCESLVATIVNMPEKTKDGPKARNDLIKLGIRKELHGGRPDDDDDDEMQETQGHMRKKAKRNEYYCPLPASLLVSRSSISFSASSSESSFLPIMEGRYHDAWMKQRRGSPG